MKKTIRLTENELKNLIAESVKRVLNEETGGFSDLFQSNEPRSKRAMQRAWKRSQEDGERRWQHYLDKQQAKRLKQTAQEENDFQCRLNDYEADCRYLASLSPEERREVERERNRWVGY